MKALNRYILEKFQITKDSKLLFTCHPKDKFELREILEERLAKDKDADLNDIDVSNITDMGFRGFSDDHGLFEDLDPHNIKIDQWDVSNVKDMSSIFSECKHFNCNLSKWDVSNVESMYSMFNYCKNFNCNLNNWNVSNVKNMTTMFYWCNNFNCDLSNWDVSSVIDMSYMFNRCEKFEGEGLENWKPIKCENMENMFVGCNSLKNIPSWNKQFYLR